MGFNDVSSQPTEGMIGVVINQTDGPTLNAKVASIRDGIVKVELVEASNTPSRFPQPGYFCWFRRDRIGHWHEVTPVVSNGRFQWAGSGRMFMATTRS